MEEKLSGSGSSSGGSSSGGSSSGGSSNGCESYSIHINSGRLSTVINNNDNGIVRFEEESDRIQRRREEKKKQVMQPSKAIEHSSLPALSANDIGPQSPMTKSTSTTAATTTTTTAATIKVSNTSTLASIICVVAGTGTLGIPHALSRSGWIGLVFLLLSSLMAQFCGCILIRCLYHQSATGKQQQQQQRLSGFPEIGKATFGRPGHVIGITFSLLLLLFTPTLYIILAGDNVSRLLAAAGIGVGRKACTWIVSAVIGIPFALVRTMRDVSFMSFFASMATVCLLLVVMTVSVSSYSDHTTNFVRHDLAIPENIPIAFSTFSFSYCGNVIFPHLESSMAEPESWPKVLLVSTFAVTIMYLLMGFLGYLVYGNSVQNPVYNSLPTGSAQNVAMLVATLHVLLAVPMYLYILTVGIEDWLGVGTSTLPSLPCPKDEGVDGDDDDDEETAAATPTAVNGLEKRTSSILTMTRRRLQAYPKMTRILVRTMEMSFCAVVAMLTPYFAGFMNLIGTIAADSLTFVLPCIFWIKLSWSRKRQMTLEILVCGCIAIIGTFCAVLGTVDAVHDFLREIEQQQQLQQHQSAQQQRIGI